MSIASDLSGIYTKLSNVLTNCNTALRSKGQTEAADLDGIADKITAIQSGGDVEWANASFYSASDSNNKSTLVLQVQSGYTATDYDVVAIRIQSWPNSFATKTYCVYMLDWFSNVGDTMGGYESDIVYYDSVDSAIFKMTTVPQRVVSVEFSSRYLVLTLDLLAGVNRITFDADNSYRVSVLLKHK